MIISKFIFGCLTAVSLCFAQSVTISGKVTDTGSTPIPGAAVRMEKGGLTATSGADGSFSLTGTANIMGPEYLVTPPKALSATICNNVLYVTVKERSAVVITTYALQGQAVVAAGRTLEAGTHPVALDRRRAGVYMYKVKAGNSEVLIKSCSIGIKSGGTAAPFQSPFSGAMAKRAQKAGVIDDVIAVTKSGFLNYRMKATNSDTAGIEIKMVVCEGTVTDIDGNTYQTVKIGNQVWTAENLRTTKYSDGTDIPHVPLISNWTNLNQPAYVIYNNTTDADSIRRFGVLYNWYVINTQKLAPAGWHVPTSDEWDTLQNFLIAKGYDWDGTTADNKIGKALAAATDWIASSVDGSVGNGLATNNKTGFSAVPSGSRYYDVNFNYIGQICYWWTTTGVDAAHADYRMLNTYLDYLDSYLALNSCGFSVRLVKD